MAPLFAARISIAVLTTVLHEIRMSKSVPTAAHPLHSKYAPDIKKYSTKPSIPCRENAFYKILKTLDIFRLGLLWK